MPKPKQAVKREKLLEEIYYLTKQLEEDKSHLAKPFADLFSFTALPVLLYFGINKSGFINYLSDYYQTYYRETVANLLNTQFATNQKIRNGAVITVRKFETQLLDIAKELMKGDDYLKQQLGIRNIEDEKTWPFPYELSNLPTTGENHLLFKIASYVDEAIHQQSGGTKLKSGFVQALNCVINAGFRYSSIPSEEMQQQIPELKGRFFTTATFKSQEISTERAAVMLRALYPDMANFEGLYQENINLQAKGLSDTHLSYMEYFVALVAAMLAKGFIVNPVAKKYFPVNFYLSQRIDTKLYYNNLDIPNLISEKLKLEEAHQQLLPFVERNKKLSHALNFLVFIYAVYLFIENSLAEGNGYLLKLIFTPLLIGLIGEQGLYKALDLYDRSNINQRTIALTDTLNMILGDAKTCIVIKEKDFGRLSLNSLKIIINSPYQELSKKLMGNLLAQTLARFGIQFLPSYTGTVFSIPMQSNFKKASAMRDFFQAAVQRVQNLEKLNSQIKKLKEFSIAIEKNVLLDQQGFYIYQYVIDLPEDLNPLKDILIKYEFSIKDNQACLSKNMPYKNEIFNELIQALQALKSQSAAITTDNFAEQPGGTKRPAKKKKPAKEEEEEAKSTSTAISAQPTITWPCGVTYPGSAKPIRGGINQFSYWALSKDDFGNYQSSYDDFKAKGEQKASKAFGKSGIKDRPTFGTWNGKQRLFVAHSKIPGTTHGDNGVLYDVEDVDGKKLYIARAFEQGIHKKIK